MAQQILSGFLVDLYNLQPQILLEDAQALRYPPWASTMPRGHLARCSWASFGGAAVGEHRTLVVGVGHHRCMFDSPWAV